MPVVAGRLVASSFKQVVCVCQFYYFLQIPSLEKIVPFIRAQVAIVVQAMILEPLQQIRFNGKVKILVSIIFSEQIVLKPCFVIRMGTFRLIGFEIRIHFVPQS